MIKKTFKDISILTLLGCCLFILFYRVNHIDKKELSWDVLGYYIYLPAVFIYDDPMLDDISWLKKINEEKQLTSTLYMVTTNDKGETMYFFLMGNAIFYLPSFLVAHSLADSLGYPADGFSEPYSFALVMGGIIYTIIGLVFFKKILRKYFSGTITSMVMLIIVFGTNYIHHLTDKNLETVNVLFMLVSIILWNTIRWHENYKNRYLFGIGIPIMLMALVKPSEVLIVLLPLLWNVDSLESFRLKIKLILGKWKQILLTGVICLIIALPQMLYWYAKTGYIVFDSYRNPGIGLDLTSPHTIDALFSYRKGWFLYTPVMIFSLVGFWFLYKENRKIFPALLISFLVSLYIITSWTEWWYGAGFSNRPLIATYPLLGIALGYFLVFISKRGYAIKIIFSLVVLFFIFLNQFQWWQFRHWVLDSSRTTRDFYWAVFLKSHAGPGDDTLKLVDRMNINGLEVENNRFYKKRPLLFEDFSKNTDTLVIMDTTGNSFYRFRPEQEYSLVWEWPFEELTKKDHVWIRLSMDIRFPAGLSEPLPCLVTCMDYKGRSYGYAGPEIPATPDGEWQHFETTYLTPEVRRRADFLKCFVWKRSQMVIDIDNFRIVLFEPK